jgi:hypothetical protein
MNERYGNEGARDMNEKRQEIGGLESWHWVAKLKNKHDAKELPVPVCKTWWT